MQTKWRENHTSIRVSKAAYELLEKRAKAERRSIIATLDLILGT